MNSSICILRNLVFQIAGRSHQWSLYFENVGERCMAKNYRPVSLLYVICEVFEKLGVIDHLQKCVLFSDFQYGFRSSWSTAYPLTVLSDKIARISNWSGATWAVALDIFEVFDRIWYGGLLHKLKSYEILGHIFDLISSFLGNRWLLQALAWCTGIACVHTITHANHEKEGWAGNERPAVM